MSISQVPFVSNQKALTISARTIGGRSVVLPFKNSARTPLDSYLAAKYSSWSRAARYADRVYVAVAT